MKVGVTSRGSFALLGLSLLMALLLMTIVLTTVRGVDAGQTNTTEFIANAPQAYSLLPARMQPLTDTIPPSIPAGLMAISVTETRVTLTWEAATDDTGVAGYRLYARIKVNPYFSRWVVVADHIVTTTVTITGLEPGARYRYAIAAVDVAGNESPKSVILLVTTLRPPFAYHPTQAGEKIFAVVGAPFQYEVDALGVPPPTFTLAAGPAGMSVDLVTGLVQWTSAAADQGVVTATVRAVNSEGSHDHTFGFPVHPAGTDFEPPGPASDLMATNLTEHGATLTWSPATDNVGVVGYRMLAQQDGHGQNLFVAGDSPGTATIFTVTTLQPNTGYRLWVAAYDAMGNVASISGLPPVHITTLVGPPTAAPTPTMTPTPTATPSPTSRVQIKIDPPAPTTSDVISITVSGVYTNSCTPQYQAHQVAGSLIAVQSMLPDQSFCLPAEFPWGYTIQVGPLAAGVYTVSHTLNGKVDLAFFTVVDAPAPPLAPPSILVDDEDNRVEVVAGQAFHLDLNATGAPTPTFTLLSGPPHMTIDPATGLIEWTPTAPTQEEIMVAVRATNSQGSDDYTFGIVVYSPRYGQNHLFLPALWARN